MFELSDEAIYTIRWTGEGLRGLIDLFNRNGVHDGLGRRIKLDLEDCGGGDVALLVTVEGSPDATL